MATIQIQEILTINGIVALVAGSAGFIIRKVWESISERREKTRVMRLTQRIEFLETALQNFYWPLYILLCKDMVVWRKNADLIGDDNSIGVSVDNQKIIEIIEKSIIIPNHHKILEILSCYSHLAEPDAEFKTQILLYIKHASLYICLRESGDIKTPKDFGAPFPMEFIKIIEKNTNDMQYEYNSLLGLKHDKSKFLNKRVYGLLGFDTPLPTVEEGCAKQWWTRIKTWFNCKRSPPEPDIASDIETGRSIDRSDQTVNYFVSNSLTPL